MGMQIVGTKTEHHTAVPRMLRAGRDLAIIGSITGHADTTLILTMDTRQQSAETGPWMYWRTSREMRLFDSVGPNALIYEGSRRSLVPEVGLEPT